MTYAVFSRGPYRELAAYRDFHGLDHGDLDADGRMDFVIGAPLARFGFSNVIGPGAAWVLYGAALLGTSGP